MNMAIAYGMKKKARGGMMCAHGSTDCEMCHGGEYAKGGEADKRKDSNSEYNHRDSESSTMEDLKKSDQGEDSEARIGGILRGGKKHNGYFHYMHGMEPKKVKLREDTKMADGGFARKQSADTLREEEKRSDYEDKMDNYGSFMGQESDEGAGINYDGDDDEDMVGRIMSNRYPHNEFESEEEASGYGAMPDDRVKEDEPAKREDDRMLNQHGEYERGPDGMDEDNEHQDEETYEHAVENQDFPEDEEDLVSRIMNQREERHYSEGGKVANYTDREADKEHAQFDDLVKDDDLSERYTGANSGDELGDEELDDEMHDIISRIMRSRAKRDRNPVPA